MDDREQKRKAMFIRVREFMAENSAKFAAGSVAAVRAAELSEIIERLDELGGDQTVGMGEARFKFAGKNSAREDLREDLSDISQTARSMNYEFPNVAESFRMPRGNSDAQLLAHARAFLSEASSRKNEFIAYGMPADFLTDLQTDIDAFEAALGTTGAATGSHVEATAEIDEAIRSGMIAVRILNGIVKNVFRNDAGKLAAWLSASHIERAPKRNPKPDAGKSPKPSN